MIIAGIIIALILTVAGFAYHHQCALKDRAEIMRHAIRHRDFMFSLNTKGLLFGEKALQETLNDMGQEIQDLVAKNEIEAWERLTRVLTHEIMNATAPIMSISQAYLSNPNLKGSQFEEGIHAIHDTSLGLVAFVDSYRKLTQMQEPKMKNISLREFCRNISAIYPELTWKIDVDDDVEINADENMLRQVFINMVKNAREAGARTIGLKWDRKLYVSNDGQSIPDEVAQEIFIPFFTTKQQGSGIGLSLSRQMLMMQDMSLNLKEYPLRGYNVTFIITKH